MPDCWRKKPPNSSTNSNSTFRMTTIYSARQQAGSVAVLSVSPWQPQPVSRVGPLTVSLRNLQSLEEQGLKMAHRFSVAAARKRTIC